MVTLRAYGEGAILADHRGGGHPCLLGLHGWGRDRRDLCQLLGFIPNRSVAPDLPGFGASPAPDSAWGASDYAAVLAEKVAASCDSPPYVVVGHSFGGRVAVCLAADRPDLVSGLVLMGAPLLRPSASRKSPKRYRLVRAAARAGLISSERLEAARRRFGSSDYRSASGVMRDVLVRVVNEEYRDELERLSCPVALVWGGDDQIVPWAVAQRAASHIDRVVLLNTVEGVGHDVHIDAPEAVADAVAAVVAASTGSSE